MDKNAIKKYAVWARRELIERVSQRAMIYGITAKDAGDPNADSVNGHLLSQAEKRQRQALIRNIKTKGYEQVIEEVAYTWFNRFAALRFMEVNGYLPSHIRVFTNDAGEFKPQILAEAIHLELDGLDMNKVYELESANKSEELFKYLLIVQCNALNSILPGMFQRIEDYTELLLPDYLLREGSVIEQMVTTISEEDWTDQVQIIGWLYQYYNTEPKDKVFADLKKNIKITKENIPAATQLFTPDWIVHYMVENSLGRLWLEGHPNDALKSEWKYYLDEAEQEPEVQAQLAVIRKEYAALKPEEIRVIDPCMGSGHILCVFFDVLVRIYEDYGYTAREAAVKIVENNLWGLDIDERAAQLSYFAVMMKARQYDRRFFTRQAQPHVYAIRETNTLREDYKHAKGDFNLPPEQQSALDYIMDVFVDAKEYGSILRLETYNYRELADIWESSERQKAPLSLWHASVAPAVPQLIEQALALTQNYHVVVTNPPYMGSSGMSARLQDFVKAEYPQEKSDLFACFIRKNLSLAKLNGFVSMITMESWMFLASFEELRTMLLSGTATQCLTHMPYLGKGGTSLGINFGTAMFCLRKGHFSSFSGNYNCVTYLDTDQDGVPHEFPVKNGRNRIQNQNSFKLIPATPFGYWLSLQSFENFAEMGTIGEYISPRIGLITGDNNRFLRLWHEVDIRRIGFGMKTIEESVASRCKWFPYQKGGDFRKWYGNLDYVVDWENDGFLMKNDNFDKGRVRSHNYNGDYSFIPCITWTSVTTGTFACRYASEGFLFDAAGPICKVNNDKDIFLFLGILSTNVARYYLGVINPTINFHPGYIMAIPFSMKAVEGQKELIADLAKENTLICQEEWDQYEHSWDFKTHPLCRSHVPLIEKAYGQWQVESHERKEKLRQNEERINQLVIQAYGLTGEIDDGVDYDTVTIREANLSSDIRSLISYAVGCMLGRYSLDTPGIAYAGGPWDSSKYSTFLPDKDGIIPICDDEYFEDDIVGRFVKFVEVVYGKDTLEDNLRFIADALGGKGSSRDVIRNYFINDFYSDHCSVYSVTGSGKRPIYWLFDSGKKNGFKCLIYMHRYQPDTIARIRTDYVHEQQSRYRTAIADLEQRINGASTSERVKLSKQLSTLQAQAEEIRIYEEKIHHLADQMIKIDLDDGVKHNYEIFKDVLAKIK